MLVDPFWLRMGSYWLKLIVFIREAVARSIEFRDPASKPASVSVFNLAVIDFLMDNYETSARRGLMPTTELDGEEDEDKYWVPLWQKSKIGRDTRAKWLEFAALCPDPWCNGLIVYAKTSQQASKIDQVSDFLKKLVFNKIPLTPQTGKWTKLGPSLDRYLVFFAVGFLWPKVMHLAFKVAGSETLLADGGATIDMGGVELDMLQELSWHAVANKRLALTMDWASRPNTFPTIAIFSVLFECIRILHRVFFRVLVSMIVSSKSSYANPWQIVTVSGVASVRELRMRSA